MLKNKKFNLNTAVIGSLLATVLLTSCASKEKSIDGWTSNQLYTEAQKEFSDANYSKSIKYYERLEGTASGSTLAQQAQLNKAYAYFKNDEKPLAVATLNRFIQLHPYSPALDYALYLKGIIYFNDDIGMFGFLTKQDLADRDPNASKQSFTAFQHLVTLFPQSKYAPDARLRMSYIINSLAKHEVQVARFYYQQEAYVAAINRAKIAIEDFQGAPVQEEALYIMAQSYKKLGLEQPYLDAVSVLKLNFPESKLLSLDGELLKERKSWWRFWE